MGLLSLGLSFLILQQEGVVVGFAVSQLSAVGYFVTTGSLGLSLECGILLLGQHFHLQKKIKIILMHLRM